MAFHNKDDTVISFSLYLFSCPFFTSSWSLPYLRVPGFIVRFFALLPWRMKVEAFSLLRVQCERGSCHGAVKVMQSSHINAMIKVQFFLLTTLTLQMHTTACRFEAQGAPHLVASD